MRTSVARPRCSSAHHVHDGGGPLGPRCARCPRPRAPLAPAVLAKGIPQRLDLLFLALAVVDEPSPCAKEEQDDDDDRRRRAAAATVAAVVRSNGLKQ